jgi:hypothetical protein
MKPMRTIITMIGNKHSTHVPHFDVFFNFKFFPTISLNCDHHIMMGAGEGGEERRKGGGRVE